MDRFALRLAPATARDALAWGVPLLGGVGVGAGFAVGIPFVSVGVLFLLTFGALCFLALAFKKDHTVAPLLFAGGLFPLAYSGMPITIYSIDIPFFIFILVYAITFRRSAVISLASQKEHIWPAMFLAWLALVTVTALSPLNSLNDTLLFARFLGVFFFFSHATRRVRVTDLLVPAAAAAAAGEGLLAIVQYVTKSNVGALSDLVGQSTDVVRLVGTDSGIFRSRGTFSYDTSLATFQELMLPMLFAHYLSARKPWPRRFYLVCMSFGALGLLLSFTRGAWLGAAFGLLAVLLLYVRRKYVPRGVVALRLAPLVLVLIVLLVAFHRPLIDRIGGSDSTATIEIRAVLAYVAIDLTLKNPITGVGLNNFSEIAARDYGLVAGYESIRRAHNIFLLFTSETGVIGCLLFVLLLWFMVLRPLRRVVFADSPFNTPVVVGFSAGLLAALVHNLAAWSIVSPIVGFFFWATAGIARGSASQRPIFRHPRGDSGDRGVKPSRRPGDDGHAVDVRPGGSETPSAGDAVPSSSRPIARAPDGNRT